MAGKIKLTIAPNGAIKSDMSGFKSCAEKTKELIKGLDLDATDITIKDKEEAVQNVTVAKQRVKA